MKSRRMGGNKRRRKMRRGRGRRRKGEERGASGNRGQELFLKGASFEQSVRG